MTNRLPPLKINAHDRFRPSLKGDKNALKRYKKKRIPEKKNPKRKSRKWLLIGSLNLGIWGLLILGGLGLWFGYDLPSISHLENVTRKPSVTLLARDGSIMATYGDLYGTFVKVDDLPDHVPQSIIAIEDRRFYQHFGIDIIGIIRAAWINYRRGSVVQGGSTLTQQLAKNFLLSEKLFTHADRSFRRKIQEILLALWLEQKFSKAQILTIYLNRVYLGAGAFGVDAAAHKYFHKSAKALTLYEAAIIAGLLKAPSRYSPISNPEMAHERAQIVLTAMEETGFITQQQMTYKTAPQPLHDLPQNSKVGRYFSDWIFETLDDYIGKVDEDVIVQTTLDSRLQKLAEEKSEAILDKEGSTLHFSQAALVAMTPDGGVRAMVGGRHYFKSQFNRATQARRQMGSSFKFFTFLCALEQGYDPHSLIVDTPIRMGKWKPKNYKYKAQGEVSLTEGFASSANAVAVRLAIHAGLKRLKNMVERLSLTTPQPADMTIALGSGESTLLELTASYGAIANHGFSVLPYGITEVRTVESGKILYKRKGQGGRRVLKAKQVTDMLTLMQAAFKTGTGKKAYFGRPCGGKTGTSQNYRDAWSIGFTPDLLTGVWVGNDDGAYMKIVTGGRIPAKIWHDFMEAAHAGYPVHEFPLK